MLTINDRKVDENYVHQSQKITFRFIVLITSKSDSCMVASSYINTHWWLSHIKLLALQNLCRIPFNHPPTIPPTVSNGQTIPDIFSLPDILVIMTI